jgi:hypothetical protein
MIQASKELSYYSFKKLVGSRLDQRSNAVECNNGNALRNAAVVASSMHTTSHCSVALKSHHVMMRGKWSVIHLRGLLTKP